MEELREQEEAAVRLLWGREGEIPAEEHARLLAEVRARREAIEREALGMLRSRLTEGRRTPRRHMVFAFAVVAVGLVLWVIALLV